MYLSEFPRLLDLDLRTIGAEQNDHSIELYRFSPHTSTKVESYLFFNSWNRVLIRERISLVPTPVRIAFMLGHGIYVSPIIGATDGICLECIEARILSNLGHWLHPYSTELLLQAAEQVFESLRLFALPTEMTRLLSEALTDIGFDGPQDGLYINALTAQVDRFVVFGRHACVVCGK